MLILTRRPGESIIETQPDGTTTTWTVMGVKGNQVRIGVAAPRNVTIDREEIHERKTREQGGEADGNAARR